MTVEARIVNALKPFGDTVENGPHTGDEERYYCFYLNRFGALYADDEPEAEKALIQVHLFAPLTENLSQRIRETQRALRDSGFLWPVVTDASDRDGRHIVFETQWLEGL